MTDYKYLLDLVKIDPTLIIAFSPYKHYSISHFNETVTEIASGVILQLSQFHLRENGFLVS